MKELSLLRCDPPAEEIIGFEDANHQMGVGRQFLGQMDVLIWFI